MLRTISALVFAAAALCAGPMAHADTPSDPRMQEHALGNPKAPVRIDEYYSLDCPHCAALSAMLLFQLCVEPSFCRAPIPLDGFRGKVQDFGGFFNRQATVETQFDDHPLSRVHIGETIQCYIDVE